MSNSDDHRFKNLHLCLRLNSIDPLSIFMPIPPWLYSFSSGVELEVRDGNTPGSSFIAQYYFNYPVFLSFFL